MDSPQARLGMLFCATLIQTDTRNRLAGAMAATVKAAESKDVPPHFVAAAMDL